MPTVAVRSTVHVLMVDDNQLGLQARKAVLEEHGYLVTALGSAEAALDLLQTGQAKFDILITDFRLPAKTGTELIGDVRAQKLPLVTVLLSGFVDAMGLNEINTGADAVLQKSSLEVPHLIRTLRSLQRRRKPMNEAAGGASAQASKRKPA
ncbi:MAG: response regulator [Acidobacteria bacterium]|nr:response regulator [Acidobacteriota bacterium]